MYGLWDRRPVRYILTAILALLALVSLIQGVRNAAVFSQDFQWDAAKTFTMKINPYDESMHPGQHPDVSEYKDYYLQMEANQFPSLLMLLIPYTFLPPLAARYAWIVSNLIFTAGIIILLRKTFLKDTDRDLFAVFMLLMIAGTPYRNQLGVGQHTLYAFFFFLLAVWFSERKDKRAAFAGTVICLFICYFKYTLTLPLCLYFVYKKRYLEIALSAGLHVILTFVSALWLSDSFINMIVKPLKVASAISADGGIDLMALFKGSAAAYVLAPVIFIMLFVMAIKLEDKRDLSLISILTLWALILTYHRTYDFFVLVLVTAFFLESKRSAYLKAFYGAVLIYIFFVLRIFSESTGSKVAGGIIYYAFTILLTVMLIREMAGKSSDNKENESGNK
ncbi:MAG: DUF2029 domain-containing protein [Lachnospiraceae bacterium]|nr:DUF2029 domain-containing protein [Lachnospiraceae bacterium]